MKQYVLVFLAAVLLSASFSLEARLKVLHMTFHNGCKQDFEEVAKELDLELTTWYVQDLPRDFWEGFSAGNEIYNVGPKRAKRVWDRHKDFFNQFDAVITSDTVPLSTIFLRNGWSKPLIIWICNRFDYAHGRGVEERFPDAEYYDLMRKAATQPNVRFVSYTPYEHVYAKRRGVDVGTRTIKPLGKKEDTSEVVSGVPANLDKENTLLLFPRLEENRVQIALRECNQRGIGVWRGAYNGPEDLKGFKGVLFFPYAFSNLALFENLQRGIVHFVPSMRFLTQLGFIRGGMGGNLQWSEWYFEEFKDALVYFDSWDDLKRKVESTNYVEMKETIRAFGKRHREEMVQEWVNLFQGLTHQ